MTDIKIASASRNHVYHGLKSMLEEIPGGFKIYQRNGNKFSKYGYLPATYAIGKNSQSGTADIVVMYSKFSCSYNIGIVTRLHFDVCPVKLLIIECKKTPRVNRKNTCIMLFNELMQVPFALQNSVAVYCNSQNKSIFDFLRIHLKQVEPPTLDPYVE